jgi:hypothetical protein
MCAIWQAGRRGTAGACYSLDFGCEKGPEVPSLSATLISHAFVAVYELRSLLSGRAFNKHRKQAL